MTLNEKIETLIRELGFSSSKFADHIGVSRPIISHIIAGRNKPSLEIIQKILVQFPRLGIEWTYDDQELDIELLKKIALEGVSSLASANESQMGLFQASVKNEHKLDSGAKSIIKIVVFYTDNSFTDFMSSSIDSSRTSHSAFSSIMENPERLYEKMISKIVIFFNDNSFSDFKPA